MTATYPVVRPAIIPVDDAPYEAGIGPPLPLPSPKSAKHPEKAIWLKEVSRCHAFTRPYREFRDLFFTMLERGRTLEGRLLVLYGDSQSGKTHILRRLMRHIDLQPASSDPADKIAVMPVLYVSAPAPCTLKALGREVLIAMDPEDPLLKLTSAPVHALWSAVKAQMRAHRVELLIIDEIHNTIKKTAVRERETTAHTIKAMLVDPHWPINVILSGTTEDTRFFLEAAEELFERAQQVEVTPISFEKRLEGTAAVLDQLDHQYGFENTSFQSSMVVKQIYLATGGHIGKIVRLTTTAAFESFLLRKSIDIAALAKTFRESKGKKQQNPFLLATESAVDAALLHQRQGKVAPSRRTLSVNSAPSRSTKASRRTHALASLVPRNAT